MRNYHQRSTHLQRAHQFEQNNGEISPEEIQRNRERAQRGLNKYIAKYKEHMAQQAAISQPGDENEKEADEVARKVSEGDDKEMDISTPPQGNNIQRNAEEDEVMPKEEDEVMCKEEEEVMPSHEEKEENLMAKSEDGGLHATEELQAKLETNKGGGQAMDDKTRGEMESKMGADLGDVRIHTGAEAHDMAEGINAKAFTYGQDVYFKNGNYNPSSKDGKNLLAHELTHTQQQKGAEVGRMIQRQGPFNHPGQTNYRFDTYKLTASDLTDPVMTDLLKGLGLTGKMIYKQKVQDPEVKYYVDDLIRETLFSNNVGLLTIELSAVDIVTLLDYFSELADDDIAAIVLSLQALGVLGIITARIEPVHCTTHGTTVDRLHRVRGNTGIIDWTRLLLAGGATEGEAREILITLRALPTNRQKVVIFDLERDGLYTVWMSGISAEDKATFPSEIAGFEEIHKEYADPVYNATDATTDEQKKIGEILTPGVTRTLTGDLAPFQDVVDGRSYRDDIIEKLDIELAWMYDKAVATLGGEKFEWDRFEVIANEAKKQTDALYGQYGSGSALTATGDYPNLFDLSEEPVSRFVVKGLVEYLITTHAESEPRYGGKDIHAAHNAIPSRREEKKIIHSVIREWGLKNKENYKKLVAVQKNWPGEQVGGAIFLQRFKKDTDRENRMFFWDTFQTMIHEYLHLITSPGFGTAARKLGGVKKGILIEGGTSYFTDQVWHTIYPDEIRANAELRKNVEGAEYPYDATVIPDMEEGHYEQIAQVREMVPVIGEENLRAAYFRGRTKSAGI
jgi:hypothetical protein